MTDNQEPYVSYDSVEPVEALQASAPGAPAIPPPPPPPPVPHPRGATEPETEVSELVDELDAGVVDPAHLTPEQEELLADAPGPDEQGDEPVVEEIDTLHLRWWQWVALWLVPVVVLAGAGVAATAYAGRPASTALDTLVPHDVGSRWVYRETENGRDVGETTQQVVGHGMIGRDPVDVIAQHYADINGAPFDETLYVGREAGQLYRYGARSANGYQALTPRQPQIAPARKGSTVTWKGTQGNDASSEIITNSGTGSVTVAGRSYDGCSHFTTSTIGTSTPTYTDVSDEWMCPHYGAVRTHEVYTSAQAKVDITLDLVALSSPARSFTTTEVPELEKATEEGVSFETGRADAVEGRLDTSRLRWTDSLQGDPAFPPTFVGPTSIAVFLSGRVAATDTDTGARSWEMAVAAPPTAAPVAARGLVLLSGGDKALTAVDAATGATRWTTRLPDVPSTAPAVVGETVVVAAQDHSVYGLSLADGKRLWQEAGEYPVTTPMVAVDEETLASVDEHGEVVLREAATGEEKWKHGFDTEVSGGLAVRGGLVYVGDMTGTLWALDVHTGDVRWWHVFRDLVSQQPAVSADRLVLAIGQHWIVGLDPVAGHQLWQRHLADAVAAPPVIVGERVVVADEANHLVQLDIKDGAPKGETPITTVAHDDKLTVRELGYAEGAHGPSLVVPLRGSLPSSLTEIAFPIEEAGDEPSAKEGSGSDATAGETAPSGVEFSTDRVTAPGTPYWNIALSGRSLRDGYAFSTSNGQVVYVSASGAPVGVLSAAKHNVPGVLLRDGIVYAQNEKTLVAVDVQRHKQLWSLPMQDPYPTVAPVLDGDLVVVPERGVGLIAVDARTGAPRWGAPIDPTKSPVGGSPVVLPGGDIVYAGGGLMRVDGKSGVRRWDVPGVQTFGALGVDEDAVYVAAFVDDAPELLAVDLRTGAVRWHQTFSPQVLAGVRAADGVVVAVDGTNALRAFDARTGAPLWSAPLGTASAGDPVLQDGRVVVDVTGAEENILEHDHRVIAWDARTGTFLGSVQATGSGFTKAAFGTAPDGSLLVPDGFLSPYTIDVMRLVSRER